MVRPKSRAPTGLSDWAPSRLWLLGELPKRRSFRPWRSCSWMLGTIGIWTAIAWWIIHAALNMWDRMYLARKNLITTAAGWQTPTMDRFGLPIPWIRIGRLTAMAIGLGKTITVGPGLARIRGVGLRITMAAGSMEGLAGAGGRGRYTAAISGHRLM